jgi:UDP-glucose 4-epimerase
VKRILIAGVQGFLGSLLAQELIWRGYIVTGVDRVEQGFLARETFENERFTFLLNDLGDGIDIEGLSKEEPLDAIFHLASRQPTHKGLTYEDFYAGNVVTTLSILDLAAAQKVKFVVYTSTTAVFGSLAGMDALNENTACLPANHYGLTKYISERLLEIALRGTGTKTAVVRFPSLMGKNHRGGLAYTYYNLARQDLEIEVFGNGLWSRNLLHVRDAVMVLIGMLENVDRLSDYEIFMAGSSDSRKMIDVAETVVRLLGASSRILPVALEGGAGGDVFIDISKAQRMLQCRFMSVEEGLGLYVKEMGSET